MPELPEVETIKTQLQPILPFRIDEVYYSDRTSRLVKTRDFNLVGVTITRIYRRAKWLLMDLDNGGHLISHLGMSGSWQMSKHRLNEKHGHIELIDHTKKNVLTYIDPRRFGHFYIASTETFKKKLAEIPVDVGDPSFDEDVIAELFFRFPNKLLKPFLLDQKAFPGVGNYMASEICARSGILPSRLTGNISAAEIVKIKKSIEVVITGAVETKGTTFSGGYRDATGSRGEGVKHLVVFYQEYCQMCADKNLETKVMKTIMNGRGTYHCPICQR
jgi:formamidopyrimidine-DNA glycosylase